MVATVDSYYHGEATYTNAFRDALASNNMVQLLDHEYPIDDTIVVGTNKQLLGSGRGATVVKMLTATKPAFQIAVDAENVAFQDFTITRNWTNPGSASGSKGDGIQCQGACENVTIARMQLSHHYRSFYGRNTNGGLLKDVASLHVIASGFELEYDTTVSKPMQWSMDNVSSIFASGYGFYVHSNAYVPAPTGTSVSGGVSLGTYINLTTFANTLGGLKAEVPNNMGLYSVRVVGGFFGEDGGHAIAVNAGQYGNNHLIAPNFIELAGQGYTGQYKNRAGNYVNTAPNGGIERMTGFDAGISVASVNPANAAGIKASNARNVLVRPGYVNGCLGDGIWADNVIRIDIDGGQVSNNGLNNANAGSTPNDHKNSIYLSSCTGQKVTNVRGVNETNSQAYGVVWTGNDIVLSGNDMRTNPTAFYGPATSLPNGVSAGNLPSNP
jgi:hypothetical protein